MVKHETVRGEQIMLQILLCYASLLKKSAYYSQRLPYYAQIVLSLLTISDAQAGFFLLVPVCGGALTLSFRFHVISDAVGARR